MVFMSTMSIEILGTTQLQIFNWLKKENIFQNISKKDSKKILNGLKNFKEGELHQHENGTPLKMEYNGTKNTQKDFHLERKNTEKQNVSFVKLNLLKILLQQNVVQTNASQAKGEEMALIMLNENVIAENIFKSTSMLKQNIVQEYVLIGIEKSEIKTEKVYDIMVEGEHEYFANGILVHNCHDSVRYIVNELRSPAFFFG
jgi:intein/homing endonuclease